MWPVGANNPHTESIALYKRDNHDIKLYWKKISVMTTIISHIDNLTGYKCEHKGMRK